MCETSPSSLLDIILKYFANNFDTLENNGLFFDQILLQDYYFTENESNTLFRFLGENDCISDKTLSLLSSPSIFPITILIINADTGGQYITIASLINNLERHLIKNLKYLKLSGLYKIPFEDLIAFFFFQRPQQSQTSTLNYFQLTHLDLSSNNVSSLKPHKLKAKKFVDVDTDLDLYFYFRESTASENPTNHPALNSSNDVEPTKNADFHHNYIPSSIQHPNISTMLPYLLYLNLSQCTLLSSRSLSMILRHLERLEILDLSLCSGVEDLSVLCDIPCRDRLRYLILHGMRVSCREKSPAIITQFIGLEGLDISEPSGRHYRLEPPPNYGLNGGNGGNGNGTTTSNTNPVSFQTLNSFTFGLLNGGTTNANNNQGDNEGNNPVSVTTRHSEGHESPIQSPRTPVHLILSSRRLTKLKKLDISGVAGLSPISLMTFLDLHPELEYLGVMLTNIHYDPRLNDIFDSKTQIMIAGENNEVQLINALKMYTERPGYVQKALQKLFSFTRESKSLNIELIEIITEHLAHQPENLGINLAGTACLYNLIKISGAETVISARLAERVVAICLQSMQQFSSNQQLQKNVILLLCNDWIINSVNFDRLLCTRLVLDCLCAYRDNRLIQMCAAITSLIAAKMTVSQVNALGARSAYIKRFLEIILERVNNYQNDSILKLCLSAIWNLTDESPRTCKNFIKENGLRVYYEAFIAFSDDYGILSKFLGSLANVAEVEGLKGVILARGGQHLVIQLIRLAKLCRTNIPVSYFACGILAHTLSHFPTKNIEITLDCATLLNNPKGSKTQNEPANGVGSTSSSQHNSIIPLHVKREESYSFSSSDDHDESSQDTDIIGQDEIDSHSPSFRSRTHFLRGGIDQDSSISSNVNLRALANNHSSMVVDDVEAFEADFSTKTRTLKPNSLPYKHEINEILVTTVSSWTEPDREMVSYRSFKPFYNLLSKPILYEYGAQAWSLWALRHVTSKNAERYKSFMDKEGGLAFLLDFRKNLDSLLQATQLTPTKSTQVKYIYQNVDTEKVSSQIDSCHKNVLYHGPNEENEIFDSTMCVDHIEEVTCEPSDNINNKDSVGKNILPNHTLNATNNRSVDDYLNPKAIYEILSPMLNDLLAILNDCTNN